MCYVQYCKNFHSAMALVKKEKETNEVFAGFLQVGPPVVCSLLWCLALAM